jgi:hypothetical protein
MLREAQECQRRGQGTGLEGERWGERWGGPERQRTKTQLGTFETRDDDDRKRGELDWAKLFRGIIVILPLVLVFTPGPSIANGLFSW